ncbi:MAG TPA: hypothetical protein VMG31_17470 [Verrucomicrobiae bacterium]|nr:hypothetical protein [Verrucomicrobiae bacterium]
MAQDNTSSINYVQSATYAPFGALTGMVNGKATGFNGINIADTYNDRLQPLQIYITTATISPTTLTQLQAMPCPTVGATIMSRSYNFAVALGDNGNVQSITNWTGGPAFGFWFSSSRFDPVGAPFSRFLRGRVRCCRYHETLCLQACIAVTERIICTLSPARGGWPSLEIAGTSMKFGCPTFRGFERWAPQTQGTMLS